MLIPFNFLLIFKSKIYGIVHIGANELEELSSYLKKNIKRIVWIEPNPNKYKLIEKKLSKYDEMFLGKFAAGSKKKKLFLNISNNSQSSSLLEMGTHKTSYPNIFYVSKVEVEVLAFDEWLKERSLDKRKYNFINIDIQGYELEALKGMRRQIKNADYIYLEVNFRQVYLNCSQIEDIDKFLSEFNFYRVGTYKTRRGWGDAIYVKDYILINKAYYSVVIPLLKVVQLSLKIIRKLALKIFKK